jgi:hypothetical protein
MDSASCCRVGDTHGAEELRFQRVTRAYTFRSGGFAAWTRARIAVIGAGLLGSRLAEEAVLSGTHVTVFEPDLLPFNVQAYCACGAVHEVVGTDGANTPSCTCCGRAMHWLRETRTEEMDIVEVRRRGILDVPLAALGIPAGALLVARSAGPSALRMLLAGSQQQPDASRRCGGPSRPRPFAEVSP